VVEELIPVGYDASSLRERFFFPQRVVFLSYSSF